MDWFSRFQIFGFANLTEKWVLRQVRKLNFPFPPQFWAIFAGFIKASAKLEKNGKINFAVQPVTQ